MGRKPRLRVSYTEDVGYLMRLKYAVEVDKNRCEEWKEINMANISMLALSLMMGDDDAKKAKATEGIHGSDEEKIKMEKPRKAKRAS